MVSNFNNQLVALVKQSLPDVGLVYLFGSHASNQANEYSDIDIAILPAEQLSAIKRWEVQQKMAERLNVNVDLVDLLSASTVMQHEIIRKGFCLYDADKNVIKFEMKVMSMYQHLNEERSELLVAFKDK